MNQLYKRVAAITVLAAAFSACEDPELPAPYVETNAPDLSANFLFVNASPDAPSLDFYVNNIKSGSTLATSETQATYQSAILSGTGIANTNIRAKASSGSVGGVLGSGDIIFRASNTAATNLSAAAGVNYTIFAIDTVNRPIPVRTLNKNNFADQTYYSSRASFTAAKLVAPAGDTTITLSVGSNNSIDIANLVRKYNGGALPSFIAAVGLVPLASSDPGGARFFLTQDNSPTFPANNVTHSAIRFINLSPNAPGLYVRLQGPAPIIAVANNASYIASVAGGLNPSVGSRISTGAGGIAFALQNTGVASVPNTYNVLVATDNAFTNIVATIPNATFSANKIYTIYASGLLGKTDSRAITAKIITHN